MSERCCGEGDPATCVPPCFREVARAQLVPCWHCGDDVPIDTADVILAKSGVAWVCEECAT